MKKQFVQNHQSKAFQESIKKQNINDLLWGPEDEILKKGSDLFLDRLHLEMLLRDGTTKIEDVVLLEPRDYEPIFHKAWFYRLADMLGVNRKVMDNYVKPGYVREFFIKYVYSRLGYRALRELRAARKIAKNYDSKLFQFLKDEYYVILHNIADEIYQEMEGKTQDDFRLSYSNKFGLPIQQLLF